LVLRTGTILLEVSGPFAAGEHPIVAMIAGDCDSTLSGFCLELALAGKSVVGSERYLMVDFD
jgi:hypothetical protein